MFFFIESKTFEFSIEEGGSFFLLRIFERVHTLLRSIFMGKESANKFLFHMEELISKQSPGIMPERLERMIWFSSFNWGPMPMGILVEVLEAI